MPYQRGNSSKYVVRQVTLTKELDGALETLSKRAGKSPSEVVRAILQRDPGIVRILRPPVDDGPPLAVVT